ncbi:MAG TPA: hypothetical protein VFT78_02160 [Hanamia sp.]|nr:hypothetical protein [Hanamia sp.]
MISTATLLGFSILPAGLIALARFNKWSMPYLPFLLCVWLACINELLSYILWRNHYYTSVNNNLYVLAEAILFLVFFRNMQVFEKRPQVFPMLLLFLVILWSWENIGLGKIIAVSSWFRIAYSFLTVVLSIALINRLIYRVIYEPWLSGERSIFLNPEFLIAAGAIIFFTFKMVVELFWWYGINHSAALRTNLYHIMMYINVIANIIYTLAIVWIPRKQPYTI